MEVYNATKRTIELRFGNKGQEEPEICALIPINESRDLPCDGEFQVVTIVNVIGKRGRKEKKYVVDG